MKVLIAVDDDAESYVAVAKATEWFRGRASIVVLHVGGTGIAEDLGAEVDVEHALFGYPLASVAVLEAAQRADIAAGMEVARRAAAVARGAARFEEGDPVTTIANVADDIGADLIVVGTGDRSFLSRLFEPSVGLGVASLEALGPRCSQRLRRRLTALSLPVPLPPSHWAFPDPETADDDGLVGIGGDLEPATLRDAYRCGLFPMPVRRSIGWWSPDPRGVLPLDGLKVSRSLRRSLRRYEVSIDTDFASVIEACADRRRPQGWISPAIRAAYLRLHELGYAHSVETRVGDELVGGLYGVAFGGLFAGESMFHRATDASKVAIVELVEVLRARGVGLFDLQWTTPHLASLGAVDIARREYLDQLAAVIDQPDAGPWETDRKAGGSPR